MKETDTMQSYKYLQAIFGDKWVDWGVSVGFLLLIASWFVPRNTVDFLVDFIVTGLMLVVAIRIGCVIVRVRRGDELSRESARSVRFREVMGNVVFLSFFVIAADRLALFAVAIRPNATKKSTLEEVDFLVAEYAA